MVGYRNRRRWTQCFEQLSLAPVPSQLKLRHKGHYIITGGLGGIGLAVAESLAETEQAKLLLLGRSQFPSRELWPTWVDTHSAEDPVSIKIRKLQNTERHGAEILISIADVCDTEQMRRAIAESQQRFGPVHGVLHAAGVPGGGVIQ